MPTLIGMELRMHAMVTPNRRHVVAASLTCRVAMQNLRIVIKPRSLDAARCNSMVEDMPSCQH